MTITIRRYLIRAVSGASASFAPMVGSNAQEPAGEGAGWQRPGAKGITAAGDGSARTMRRSDRVLRLTGWAEFERSNTNAASKFPVRRKAQLARNVRETSLPRDGNAGHEPQWEGST
jgi:hypothetical protein